MPRISWLLPVKDAMPFLPEALASIAGQTYVDHEVLAWDNGSTDGSLEELRRWIPERIPGRIVGTEPLSLGASLAALVSSSHAELLARLDADDIAEPERLALQVEALDQHPGWVGVGTWVRLIDAAGQPTGEEWSYPSEPWAVRWQMFFSNCVVHPSVLLRREAVLRAGNYPDQPKGQDYALWLSMLRHGSLANLPRCLLRYRRHPATIGAHTSHADRAARARALAREFAPALFPPLSSPSCMKVWERHSVYGSDPGPPTRSSARTARRMAAAVAAREQVPLQTVLASPGVHETTDHLSLARRAREQAGILAAKAVRRGLRTFGQGLALAHSSPRPNLQHLVLFLTRDMSLESWAQLGILERELALYRELSAAGVRVSVISYGGRHDADLAPDLEVLTNRWGLSPDAYRGLLPVLHGSTLRRADVYKTNQTQGSAEALAAAQLWHKPLVVRCGYSFSHNQTRRHGEGSQRAEEALWLEACVFPRAARIFLTTPALRDELLERFPALAPRVRIVPNGIDTDLFRPAPEVPSEVDAITVGGLFSHKNTAALLEAAAALDASVRVIGEGPLRSDLERRFARPGVELIGRVPNHELPGQLARARVFVLPSLYEGHPKALLEALACGLPIVASAVPGISDLLDHERNGLLCAPEPEDIAAALKRLLDDAVLAARLGASGRALAVERYALADLHPRERGLLQEVVQEWALARR